MADLIGGLGPFFATLAETFIYPNPFLVIIKHFFYVRHIGL